VLENEIRLLNVAVQASTSGGSIAASMAKKPTIAGEIERYLRTGNTDPVNAAWPGGVMEGGHRAHDDLRRALVSEVKRLAHRKSHRPVLIDDTVALTRRKVEPMVRGLFSRAEQETVLATLERSVVFLTTEKIEPLLMEKSYDKSAWDLANLYFASVGAKLLGKDAMNIVGLSEHMTCYVSTEYFRENDDRFADFVVHEAAHIFHNCKRRTIGLRETRTREWLLDIEFKKRETFAYSCEAYARVVELAPDSGARRALAADYASKARISEERVDATEVAAIVQDAAAARNGWKVIMARCAAPKKMPIAQWIREQAAVAVAARDLSQSL
jgi:hypothetical protein